MEVLWATASVFASGAVLAASPAGWVSEGTSARACVVREDDWLAPHAHLDVAVAHR